jgi:two-component system OmpR family response regulator
MLLTGLSHLVPSDILPWVDAAHSWTAEAGAMNPTPSPVHVLIVDEEEPITHVLRLGLELEGWTVSTVHSAADAIAFAGQPDIILLDMMLPDQLGTDVVAALRRNGSTAHVIFLTGRDDHEDRMSAYAAGGDDYLTKPFSVEEVVDRVDRATRRLGRAPESLRVDDLVLDVKSGRAWRGADMLSLASIEFELLRELVERRGTGLSAGELVSAVGHRDVRVPRELAQRALERTRDSVNAGGDPLLFARDGHWLVA